MAQGTWGGLTDPRVFRAKILFIRGGQQCQTSFHLRDVGLNTLSPQDVAEEVADFVTDQFRKILLTSDDIVGIDAENLETRDGYSISPANQHGLLNEPRAPSFLTVPVSLKTSLRRRYGSGRMLWPVATALAQDGNQITPGLRAVMDGVIADMLSRYTGSALTTSMQLVHLHDVIPATSSHPDVPRSWYDVVSIRLNTTISMLSSRKSGHGV